jgi:hypothetical protein
MPSIVIREHLASDGRSRRTPPARSAFRHPFRALYSSLCCECGLKIDIVDLFAGVVFVENQFPYEALRSKHNPVSHPLSKHPPFGARSNYAKCSRLRGAPVPNVYLFGNVSPKNRP